MTALPAILSRQQGAAPPAGPVLPTDLTLHSLFWAEGDDFVAKALSHGDRVFPWPNETGESSPTCASWDAPHYDESWPGLNDKPAVDFTLDGKLSTGSWSVNPDYTDGVTVFAVADGTPANSQHLFSGQSGGARLGRASDDYWLYAGASQYGSAFVDGPHFFVIHFTGDSGNDRLWVDGVLEVDGNAGSSQMTGFSLGTYAGGVTSRWRGTIALLGIAEGDSTLDPQFAGLQSWVTDHYGVSIA